MIRLYDLTLEKVEMQNGVKSWLDFSGEKKFRWSKFC